MKLHPDILSIISRLDAAGHEAYVVGGSLRDSLLGKRADDVDMTTSALPEETMAVFSDMRIIPTGLKHGTVTLLTDSGAVEITTFRTDGEYTDSRHPDSVTFTRSLEEDLARRDFTVNAMAYSPERGVVDIFGGRDDLAHGIIRCVGEPYKRFSEDALRILRAFRFSAQLGFSIDEGTLGAAMELGHTLTKIARERICTELLKLLSAPDPTKALHSMLPIMQYVLPDVTVDRSRIDLCAATPRDPLVRLAVMIHGSGRAAEVSHSLRLSNGQRRRLMRLSSPLPHGLPSSPADARRLLASLSEDAEASIAVHSAVSGLDPSVPLALVAAERDSDPCLSLSRLAIRGDELIALGIARGRQVGKILEGLLAAVIETPSLNEKNTLLCLARELSARTEV